MDGINYTVSRENFKIYFIDIILSANYDKKKTEKFKNC
jgi:hypothetical protein